jgi:hypothetical protein
MNDVSRLLSAVEQGDAGASEQLLPLVYDELRKLAAQCLTRRKTRGSTSRGIGPVMRSWAK